MPRQFDSLFALGQQVTVNKQKDLIGRITAITFRMTAELEPYAMYQVDWIRNGTNQSFSIEGWRLDPVSKD